MVRASGAQARVAYRVSVRALHHLGRGQRDGSLDRAPRGAAVRPLLVDSIRKERRRRSGECAEERGRLKLQQDL